VVEQGDRERTAPHGAGARGLTPPRMLRQLRRLMRGSDAAPLVVRAQPPALRNVLLAAGSLIALFALYVFYELGRYDAGYDRLAVAQRRTELEVRIEHLEKDNRELRTRLAELDTIRLGRAREQAEVARSMGDLQAQIARQSQELAFYRGVVAQNGANIGLKIQSLRVSGTQVHGLYVVHLALVRSGRAETLTTGTVELSVDGAAGGAAQQLDLAALTGGRTHNLGYDFRYFQNFDQDVTIPAMFKPEHVTVLVKSARGDASPLSQTFLWSVEPPP
jgi:hypothetical protein